MADAPLHTAEEDLASIAARHAPDALLVELIRLGDTGAGLSLGFLLNGMIVTGQLVRSEEIAESIDADRATLVARLGTPEGQTDEEWAEAKASFSRAARRGVEAFRDQLAQLDRDVEAQGLGRGEVEVDKVPAELGRRVIFADARSHLTLARVRCFSPGQQGELKVPVMRVQLSQVAAWWITPADAEGRVSMTVWGPVEDPDIPST